MVLMGRVQMICDFWNYNYWTGNAIGFRASSELCSNFLCKCRNSDWTITPGQVGHIRNWMFTNARNWDGRCCYCEQTLIRNWDQKWVLLQVIWMIIHHTAMLWALTVRYLTGDYKGQKPEMDRPFLPFPGPSALAGASGQLQGILT